MANPSLSTKRKLLFYAIAYSVFLAALLLIEIGVRQLLPPIASIRYFVAGPTQADDPAGAAVFEGDPLLGWHLKAHLKKVWWDYTYFSTDNRHIRYHRDIGAKPENTFRIVCLGDSVTFGYRVPVSWPEHPDRINPDALPFPDLIEKRLKELFPEKTVECIPLAAPGYSSHQGLAWLKRDIDWLRPDILIVSYGWNDTDFRRVEDKASLPTDRLSVAMRFLCSKSQAILHILKRCSAFNKTDTVATQQVNRVSSEDYIKNMMAITSLAKAHGSQIVVIGQFYRDSTSHPRQAMTIALNRQRLKKACKTENIAYLEIQELTEAHYPANKQLFGELIHPNHLGHKMIAERLIPIVTKLTKLG